MKRGQSVYITATMSKRCQAMSEVGVRRVANCLVDVESYIKKGGGEDTGWPLSHRPRGVVFQGHLRGARRFASCTTAAVFGATLLTLRAGAARRYASRTRFLERAA